MWSCLYTIDSFDPLIPTSLIIKRPLSILYVVHCHVRGLRRANTLVVLYSRIDTDVVSRTRLEFPFSSGSPASGIPRSN